MFNLMDIILIAIIAIAGFVGYKLGFIKAVISFLSFFVAIGVALAFYNPLSVILAENTSIDEWIVDKIMNYSVSGDAETQELETTTVASDTGSSEGNAISEILADLPDIVSNNLNLTTFQDSIRHEIAKRVSELIMKLLSLIILYVVVKLTLSIALLVLGGMMKLPVLKQLNEILGMGLGAIIGFLNMYLVFGILTFVSSITNIDFIVDAIKSSMFASVMYDNNIIINILFQ